MSALHTTEVRWFFRSPPFESRKFFADQHRAPSRTDWYSYPCDVGCGIKFREGRLETKLRSGEIGATSFRAGMRGNVETWTKWSMVLVDDHPEPSILLHTNWIRVDKTRFVQRFEPRDTGILESAAASVGGCSFELTELIAREQTWWTVGFEAIRAPDELPDILRRVVDATLGDASRTAEFAADNSFGYPYWLQVLSGAA